MMESISISPDDLQREEFTIYNEHKEVKGD